MCRERNRSGRPRNQPETTHNMPAEIDFLGLDKQQQQQQQQPSPSNSVSTLNSKRPSSIRDIQKAMARLSPDLLWSVIASDDPRQQPSSTRTSAPLTIFYNGMISVFDATHDVAENVMKMAAGAHRQQLQQQRGILLKEFHANGDMPLLRKKSLQRFLEKRRERLISVAPYPASSSSSVGDVDGHVDQTSKNSHKKMKEEDPMGRGFVA